MSLDDNRTRQPSGRPTGGQYAPEHRTPSGLSLTEPVQRLSHWGQARQVLDAHVARGRYAQNLATRIAGRGLKDDLAAHGISSVEVAPMRNGALYVDQVADHQGTIHTDGTLMDIAEEAVGDWQFDDLRTVATGRHLDSLVIDTTTGETGKDLEHEFDTYLQFGQDEPPLPAAVAAMPGQRVA